MTIHKEGFKIVGTTLILMIAINFVMFLVFPNTIWMLALSLIATITIQILVTQFFRVPSRKFTKSSSFVVAPCDGKVVVIENAEEPEYFKGKRLQLSIFMSPLNVHVNWYPISGKVSYLRYHPGKYLVAWDPKSSTENERTTIVISLEKKVEILVRQIAGAVARRIVYYPQEGDIVKQCMELGFIKFGSRVDVFLPVGTKVNVAIGDKTVGGVTVLAELD